MNLSDFDYNLPEELIAQTPIEPRDSSRILIMDKISWDLVENKFYEIEKYLWENDVLVLNETRVINARLKWIIDIFPNGKKKEKQVEIFLHKQINSDTWECLGYPWKNLKIGKNIEFRDSEWNVILNWKIEKISEMWRFIKFDKSWFEFLETIDSFWELPLPPYIKNKLKNSDRYQTVFAKDHWSAAAPTAWLHFTENLLEKLEKNWVKIEKVLLHVWVGTFKPVEVEDLTKHYMHSEYIEIKEEVANKLNKYKKDWKNIIAVWTTCVRVLESFSDEKWNLSFGNKDTSIFIYPGYKWKFVESLITNFHLPKSTLLMLISSLWWKENIKKAYNYAIKNKFRFFSFWDAMWIKK